MIDLCHCGHLAQTHAHPGHSGCRSPTCGCAAFESEDQPVQISLLDVLRAFLPPAVPVPGVLVPLEPEIGLQRVAA